MQHPIGRLFTFVVVLFISLFTATVLAVAIPNPDTADFGSSLEARVQGSTCWQPPDCGSSPFQTPCNECNSASNLHLPFRSVFKLPALFINTLVFATNKIHAAAVAIPNHDTADFGSSLEARLQDSTCSQPPDCGSSPFQTPCNECNSASSLHLPFRSVFKLPALFINTLVFVTNNIHAAAVSLGSPSQIERSTFDPNDPDRSRDLYDQERRQIARGVENGDGFMQFPSGATSGLEVPSIFTVPTILFNAVDSIPGVLAATTPIHNKTEGEAKNLSRIVELPHLSRSLVPRLSDIRPLFQRAEKDGIEPATAGLI
jgi:hypothetical protein